MKDFAKKHPVNKSKSNKGTATLRARRELNQPLKIKHFFIVAGMAAILFVSSQFLLQTDVKNLRGHVTNPTVEFFYPIDLEKDTVLIELEGISYFLASKVSPSAYNTSSENIKLEAVKNKVIKYFISNLFSNNGIFSLRTG